MTDDITYIDGAVYRITERVPVRYPMQESDAERKARGNKPVPMIEFMACKVEKVRESLA